MQSRRECSLVTSMHTRNLSCSQVLSEKKLEAETGGSAPADCVHVCDLDSLFVDSDNLDQQFVTEYIFKAIVYSDDSAHTRRCDAVVSLLGMVMCDVFIVIYQKAMPYCHTMLDILCVDTKTPLCTEFSLKVIVLNSPKWECVVATYSRYKRH